MMPRPDASESSRPTGASGARHRFSPEIRHAVQTHYALDNWHGPLEILEHWSFIAIAALGSIWAWRTLPVTVSIPMLAVALFVIGGRQRALAGVLHQACHGTLMANRAAGRWLAAIFGGYPVFQSVTGYSASHVRDHHGHFGDPEVDPDYQYFLRAGLYREDCGREAFRRHLLGIFSPASSVRYIAFLLRHRMLNPQERRGEMLLRMAFYAGIAAIAVRWHALWVLAVYWFLPLATTQVWIGSFAELLEHYPYMARDGANNLARSRNRDFGALCHLVFGEKRGEGYHLVHHLFPQVPLWRLHRVHRVLLADPDYAALHVPSRPLDAFRSIEAELPPAKGKAQPATT